MSSLKGKQSQDSAAAPHLNLPLGAANQNFNGSILEKQALAQDNLPAP